MTERFEFTSQEREDVLSLYNQIKQEIGSSLLEGDEEKMRQYLTGYIEQNHIHRDVFGLNPMLLSFQTAQLVVEEVGLKRDAVLAVLLHPCIEDGYLCSLKNI